MQKEASGFKSLTFPIVFILENRQLPGPMDPRSHQARGVAVSSRPRQCLISAKRGWVVPVLTIDLAVTAGNRHKQDSLVRDKNINVID